MESVEQKIIFAPLVAAEPRQLLCHVHIDPLGFVLMRLAIVDVRECGRMDHRVWFYFGEGLPQCVVSQRSNCQQRNRSRSSAVWLREKTSTFHSGPACHTRLPATKPPYPVTKSRFFTGFLDRSWRRLPAAVEVLRRLQLKSFTALLQARNG